MSLLFHKLEEASVFHLSRFEINDTSGRLKDVLALDTVMFKILKQTVVLNTSQNFYLIHY